MTATLLPTEDDATQLDNKDPLHEYRARFFIAEPDLIYLDGNSLGRLPLAAQTQAEELITQQWGTRLIRSWNEGWMATQQRIGDKLAHLLGARENEVVVADATSINLFKLAAAALQQEPGRHEIITDDLNFPSDIYIFQGLARLLGTEIEIKVVPSPDGIHGPVAGITHAISKNTALVSLSHTVFKSGYTYDMAEITVAAHAQGALVLWDLSHSAGVLPVRLHETQADLAVGCTYKHINGGPGAPAFLYVREDLQTTLHNPISGWWGQQGQFDFDLHYRPAGDIRRMLSGTPPLLSTALIESGVDLILEAGIETIHEKAKLQSRYLVGLYDELLADLGYALNAPREAARRGAHISLGHPEGLRITKALIDRYNIIPDFRTPDNIRLGFAPLYTRYQELYRAAHALKEIVSNKIYLDYSAEAPDVT